jgi:hypothetical protein
MAAPVAEVKEVNAVATILSTAASLYNSSKTYVPDGYVRSIVEVAEGTVIKAYTKSGIEGEKIVSQIDGKLNKDFVPVVEPYVRVGYEKSLPYYNGTVEKVEATQKYVEDTQSYIQTTVDDTKTLVQNKVDETTKYVEDTKKYVQETSAKVVEATTAGVELVKSIKSVDDVIELADTSVDYALPASEDEKTEESARDENNEEEKLDANQLTTQRKLLIVGSKLSNRLQRKALLGLTHLRRRSVEVTHVDLIDYANQFIDQTKVKTGETYDATYAFVENQYTVTHNFVTENVVKPVTEASENVYKNVEPTVSQVRESVEVNVIQPAVGFYTTAMTTYLNVSEEEAKNLTAADFTAKVQESLGSAWNNKFVEPTNQFYDLLKTEFNVLKKEGENADGEVESTKLITAVSDRLRTLWAANVYEPAHQQWSKFINAAAAATVDDAGRDVNEEAELVE